MKRLGVLLVLAMGSGCNTNNDGSSANQPSQPNPWTYHTQPSPQDGLQQLATDIGRVFPGTDVQSTSPDSAACGQGNVPVVHMVLPERVLFQTASDDPAQSADPILDFVATNVEHDSPAAEITVLGHTDAVGSDAYNLDLSKRRAETIMRALIARGLLDRQVSAVAIGKRQPVADNDTPEGRAQNRRVEFLVSPCLAANLEAVQRVSPGLSDSPAGDADVSRLAPKGGNSYELQSVGTVSLNAASVPAAEARPGMMVVRKTQRPIQPSPLRASVGPARSSPSPAYAPRTLAPDAEKSTLGPAISY